MKLSAIVFALAAVAALPTTSGAQPTAEDESASFVADGRRALQKKNYKAAAKALDAALAINPRRIDAYVLRSAVHAANKEYAAGIALMQRALELAPTDLDVQSALGTQLVLGGEVVRGLSLLQSVVEREPKRFEAQLLLARTNLAQSRFDNAVTSYQRYFAHRPPSLAEDDAAHRIDLADALLRARKPQNALNEFVAARKQATQGQQAAVAERAKLGELWALAAIDCKQTRKQISSTPELLKAHSEVVLLDGQCALALGDSSMALRRGRAYLANKDARADGHALVGEALAARGDVRSARNAFDQARQLEPSERRWAIRHAAMLRRSGNNADALAALKQFAPPAVGATNSVRELEWWSELGEILLAQGDANAVATELAPVTAAVRSPASAQIHLLFGTAQLRLQKYELAIAELTLADQLRSSKRSRQVLAAALSSRGTELLLDNKFDLAIAQLAKANELSWHAVTSRNLAIAYLATERANDAKLALTAGPAKLEWDPHDSGLLALALIADTGSTTAKQDEVRTLFAKAIAGTTGAASLRWAIESARFELSKGDPSLAVTVLENQRESVSSDDKAKLAAVIGNARSVAGYAALRSGNAAKAVELWRDGLEPTASIARKCELALAATIAGDREMALPLLRGLTNKSCPFRGASSSLAVPVFEAFLDGQVAKRSPAAIAKLERLAAKANGELGSFAAHALRLLAINAAVDAYRSNDLRRAKSFLATAQRATTKAGNDELAVNLAIVELAEGKIDTAIAQLERVAAKIPEALISIGVGYERKQDTAKALDAWRRARKQSTRFTPLADWIEAKERIFGEENSP